MNRLYLLTMLSFIYLSTIGQSTPSEYIVLISIDGFRPQFYQEEQRPAPNRKQMAHHGVSVSGVRGVFPSVTYPSHTTMITGAKPIDHGIYYNAPFEPEEQTGR